MPRFSANLGFLWTELSPPAAIRRAAAAGFGAVEAHWLYDTPAAEVKEALDETGLPLLGINTVRGDVAAGENGLAGLKGREEDARAAIDQALNYAAATGAGAVHVMAGRFGDTATFVENLRYASDRAGDTTILIEPLNSRDAPDYLHSTTDQAAAIIEATGRENVKIMFDAYHIQIMQGDLTRRLEATLPLVGHIQFAAVPSRAEPDEGEVCYERFLRAVDEMGWNGFVGAEYKPRATTDEGLGWMKAFQG